MSKIAVIGPRDAILAFSALGADTFPASDRDSALSAIEKARTLGYQLVFVTETVAEQVAGPLKELQNLVQPVFTVIPDNRGTQGIGLKRIKERVEKAIGVDILFKGEEKA